ncbi:MAG: hypothetical protein ABI480_09975 [Chitinophagaceae bacterium]
MRTFFTYILLICAIFLNAQTTQTKQKTSEEKEVEQKDFANQGDWENHEIKQIFKTKYSKQEHQVFEGKITTKDNFYQFDKDCIEAFTNNTFKVIFEKGILYPELIAEWINPDAGIKPKKETSEAKKENSRFKFDSLAISNFEEIKFVDHLPTQRRFRCWVRFQFMFNPILCVVELSNENATEKTDMQTFVKDASLTFFRQVGVVI